jgi:DNA mismatch endonuclease, patch repair protein
VASNRVDGARVAEEVPPAPTASSEGARRVMQGNRGSDTTPERRVRSALHARGLRFRKNLGIRTSGRLVRPDVVFTRQRVAVFIDGCFWHRCPEHGTSPRTNSDYWQRKLDRNVRRDEEVTRALEAAGWRVLRFWEHTPPGDVASVVEEIVTSRSPS